MAEQYVVYVAAPTQEPDAETRQRLSELLGLDPHKLDSLLRRLPAEVTKPIPESTAVAVARRFREAGLQASIRVPGTLDAATAAPPPVGPPLRAEETTAGPAPEKGAEDTPSIWKTQFGASRPPEAEGVSDEDEDEEDEDLFPRSSFEPPNGPKAPSRRLLIALLLVLVVLAALWYLL
ncbi:MAG TPA: hypothetical protein VF168_00515 [Trueperaceae bacterium]